MNVYQYPKIDSKKIEKLSGSLTVYLASFFNIKGQLRILEIGCGYTSTREYFVSKGHSYTAIDLESDRADIIADMHSLPFENSIFDAIYSTATFQYSHNPENAFKECFRVLKKGGSITGTISFLEPGIWGSKCNFSPIGLNEALTESGFEAQYIWPNWSVFEAIEESLKQMGNLVLSSEEKKILTKANRILYSKGKWLGCNPWEYAGSLSFHAIRQDFRK